MYNTLHISLHYATLLAVGDASKHDDSLLNGSVERLFMDTTSQRDDDSDDNYATKFVQPIPGEIRQEFEYGTDWENDPNFMKPVQYGVDLRGGRFATDQFGNRLYTNSGGIRHAMAALSSEAWEELRTSKRRDQAVCDAVMRRTKQALKTRPEPLDGSSARDEIRACPSEPEDRGPSPPAESVTALQQ